MSESLTAIELVEKIRNQFPVPYDQYLEVKKKIEERETTIIETLDALRNNLSNLLHWEKSDYTKNIHKIRDNFINYELKQNVESLQKPNWYQPSKGGLVKYKIDTVEYSNSGNPCSAPDSYIDQIRKNAQRKIFQPIQGNEEIILISSLLEDIKKSSEKHAVQMIVMQYKEQSDYLTIFKKSASDIISYGESYAPTSIIEMNSNIINFSKTIGMSSELIAKITKAYFFTKYFQVYEGKIILIGKSKKYTMTSFIEALYNLNYISDMTFKSEDIFYHSPSKKIKGTHKAKYLIAHKSDTQNYKDRTKYFQEQIQSLLIKNSNPKK